MFEETKKKKSTGCYGPFLVIGPWPHQSPACYLYLDQRPASMKAVGQSRDSWAFGFFGTVR